MQMKEKFVDNCPNIFVFSMFSALSLFIFLPAEYIHFFLFVMMAITVIIPVSQIILDR
jgi:hypothetical protein